MKVIEYYRTNQLKTITDIIDLVSLASNSKRTTNHCFLNWYFNQSPKIMSVLV